MSDPDTRRPPCLDGQHACPPEDVGGEPEYADFLDANADPAHAEHAHFLERCGASVDLVLVNQRLSQVKF